MAAAQTHAENKNSTAASRFPSASSRASRHFFASKPMACVYEYWKDEGNGGREASEGRMASGERQVIG